MYNSYINGEDHCPKTLADALNVIVNWKRGSRYSAQQYKTSKGVALTTKVNPGGFRLY